MPAEDWIEIPVPALVNATIFEAARRQLDENRHRKRDRKPGQCWLLQGLTVCRRCGYAYYGTMAPRSRPYDPANTLRYYRCTGADGYRFNGKAVCGNGPVRSDQLEHVVWAQVTSLLREPQRVADEYRRRIGEARDGAVLPDEIGRLDQQMTTLRRGIGRLIDSYAEGIIEKAEFEPRIAGLKQRLSLLQDRHQAGLDAMEMSAISRLEDFSIRVTKSSRTSTEPACRTLSERSSAGSKSTTITSRLSSASRHPETRLDHLRPRQVRHGNIVRTFVERFFAWISRNRRLWKDPEATLASAKAFLYAASVMILVRRLAKTA